jgi:hypothetical protein
MFDFAALTMLHAFARPSIEARPSRPRHAVTCRWTRVASPSVPNEDSTLFGVSGSGLGDLWAVGHSSVLTGSTLTTYPLTEHWDGTSWTIASAPIIKNGVLNAVSDDAPNDAWAVGWKQVSLGGNETRAVGLLEHWDGKSWSVARNPTGYKYFAASGVVAFSATDSWALSAELPGSATPTWILHWNGVKWSLAKKLSTSGGAYSIGGSSPDDVWAVAYSGFSRVSFFEHWDGHTWTNYPDPSGISTMVAASGPRGAVSIGSACIGECQTRMMGSASWDGSTWTNVPISAPKWSTSPTIGGIVAFPDGSALALGSNRSGTLSRRWALSFNGTAWKTIEAPRIAGDAGFGGIMRLQDNSVWAVGAVSPPGEHWQTVTEHGNCTG